jgi:hypothetical protein
MFRLDFTHLPGGLLARLVSPELEVLQLRAAGLTGQTLAMLPLGRLTRLRELDLNTNLLDDSVADLLVDCVLPKMKKL